VAGIGRQQDLGALEFAGGSFAFAQHRGEFTAFGLAQFDPITYIHLDLLVEGRSNRQMNQKSGTARSLSAQAFTEKQGQYLAFIYTYSHMFRRPPAETDIQRHFQVSPPSVHQMIVTLERNGLIQCQPGVARSIQVTRSFRQLRRFHCSIKTDRVFGTHKRRNRLTFRRALSKASVAE